MKAAFLVDGDLEQKFIQTVCPGSTVRKINCNGESVSLEAIARRVGTLGRLLHKRHSPIVVVFDREKRGQTSEEIERHFYELLRSEKLDVPIIVGVPDRNIESWILADYEKLVSNVGLHSPPPHRPAEGENGKKIIRELLGERRSYVETIDGVEWLKAARFHNMIRHSASFLRFASALSKVIECWWLKSRAEQESFTL